MAKKLLLYFFITGTLVMMFVMAKTGNGLKTPATPMGIIDLEFAYDTTKVQAVLKAWAPVPGSDNIKTARINTWFDFAFLFFYSGLLYIACNRIASAYSNRFSAIGKLIAKASIGAGILDILENIGMLLSLQGLLSPGIALSTTVVSVLKWILALIAVLYVLLGSLYGLFRKMNVKA